MGVHDRARADLTDPVAQATHAVQAQGEAESTCRHRLVVELRALSILSEGLGACPVPA